MNPTPLTNQDLLSIDQFKTMDHKAITEYFLPIELMMENAGLNLARFITMHASRKSIIMVGVGTGNNGGGGLVAARRLAGWGYRVYLDIPDPKLKQLPTAQLERAKAFGASTNFAHNPGIFVDAYFGFSQRPPIPQIYLDSLLREDIKKAFKVSLDLPSGFDKDTGESIFIPNSIITLAAPKTELIQSRLNSEIFVADIGLPVQLYEDLGVTQPDFGKQGFVKYQHNKTSHDGKNK